MRGFLYSLEALIAIGVIFVALIFLFGTTPTQTPTRSLKILGDNALHSLDASGLLREYALTQDSASIVNQLSGIIPVTVNYNVSFCRLTCTSVTTPKTTNVFTSFYYYAGAPGNYTPTEVVLYLWEK